MATGRTGAILRGGKWWTWGATVTARESQGQLWQQHLSRSLLRIRGSESKWRRSMRHFQGRAGKLLCKWRMTARRRKGEL